MLTPNFFPLCPSFLHLNMLNILPGKGFWKKKKAEMSRWIWHGWQSPEVKKLEDWWIDLLPPGWARGLSSNIFPFDYLQPKRCSWLQSLPASRLLSASSSGWLESGQAAVAGAVLCVATGSRTPPNPWPYPRSTFFLSMSSLQPLPLFPPSLSSLPIPSFSSPFLSSFSCAQGLLFDISVTQG